MKKIIIPLIAGIVLRLALMPITSHPDIRGHYLGAYFITYKKSLLTVYDYISRLPRANPLVSLYGDDFLVYSPLTYLSHAGFLKILSPIFPIQLFEHMEIDIGNASQDSQFPFLIFLLKLPYLFVDLGILWLLLRLVDQKHKSLATILWAFNLPMIYSAFLIGQFDVLMVFFIVLSLFYVSRKQYPLASVFIALAAGFKPFPLFFLPFIPGKKLKNIAIGGLTYLAIIAPYLFTSPGFRMYALLAPQTDKIWYAKIFVSGSQYLSLFAVGLAFLFWFRHAKEKLLPYWGWFMAVLLLFFSVTHFHPQWFSWITPFLILLWVSNRKFIFPIIILLLCYTLVVLSFEPSLNLGLFGLNLNLFNWVNAHFPADQLVSIIRSLFAATGVYLIFAMSKEKQ